MAVAAPVCLSAAAGRLPCPVGPKTLPGAPIPPVTGEGLYTEKDLDAAMEKTEVGAALLPGQATSRGEFKLQQQHRAHQPAAALPAAAALARAARSSTSCSCQPACQRRRCSLPTFTQVVDFHQTVDVGGVRVTAYRACHVLGAAMFQVGGWEWALSQAWWCHRWQALEGCGGC